MTRLDGLDLVLISLIFLTVSAYFTYRAVVPH